MLHTIRRQLSQYRQQGGLLPSLVDFSLWSLRTGLPPWRLGFWLVVLSLAVLLTGSIVLGPVLSFVSSVLAILVGVGVLLGLALGYVRATIHAASGDLHGGGGLNSNSLSRIRADMTQRLDRQMAEQTSDMNALVEYTQLSVQRLARGLDGVSEQSPAKTPRKAPAKRRTTARKTKKSSA